MESYFLVFFSRRVCVQHMDSISRFKLLEKILIVIKIQEKIFESYSTLSHNWVRFGKRIEILYVDCFLVSKLEPLVYDLYLLF